MDQDYRIGIGYDVHPLVEGRPLVIGGVRVPSAVGLDGHSDADVLCHSVAEALLGAAALGNIGTNFPNSDPTLKNISSLELLKRVKFLLEGKFWTIVNVDSTVTIERPRLSPHFEEMRERISSALGVTPDSVSVKATTGEGLGFVGKGEGASAYAVALIRRKR